MATTRRAYRPRLIAVDGAQIAPLPPRSIPGATQRQEQEILVMVIKEHVTHIVHSLSRIATMTRNLEANLGINVPYPSYPPEPLRDAPDPDRPKPLDPSA